MQTTKNFGIPIFAVSFLLLLSATGAGEAPRAGRLSDFMRVVKKEGRRQPHAFETAIVKLVDEKNEVEVDLIAAVHIGDKEYYEELNGIFKNYEAVLYELVAEEGTRIDREAEKNRDKKNLLSGFQAGMGRALNLDFQLDHIDYTAANLVHADLSPEEFARRAAERGDLIQMLYRTIVLSTKKGKDGRDEESRMQGRLVGTLFASNPSLALKRFFSREMVDRMDDSAWIIDGEGSAIITDRNEAALRVLRRELDAGKKKIAVFYGAAHLPDFVKNLEKKFKLKPKEISWVVAWDLTSDRSTRKN